MTVHFFQRRHLLVLSPHLDVKTRTAIDIICNLAGLITQISLVWRVEALFRVNRLPRTLVDLTSTRVLPSNYLYSSDHHTLRKCCEKLKQL